MSNCDNPIVFSIEENQSFFSNLQTRLESVAKNKEDAAVLLSFPTVYIHYWPGRIIEYTDKKGQIQHNQQFHVYIGESNDIVSRTREHYSAGEKQSNWQYYLTHSETTPNLIVVGHKHFNKSFTLDLENRLIEYMMSSVKSVETLYNGRGNPQNDYYPSEEFESVFQKVWRGLRASNRKLFLSQSEIERSALFKASPFKKLTDDQINTKETIIAKIYEALDKSLDGQLIIVQGEAGTGKTVLVSSLFYELISNGKEYFGYDVDCHLMVNHDQQENVYIQMAQRLSLGDNIIHKPTSFINSFSPERKIDVAFIDEGHLLLTQGKQSYQGRNQLADIIQRAKVTVLMFDEYQILTAEQYWEPNQFEHFKSISINQGNYLALSQQLRMQCSQSTQDWLNNFILCNALYEFTPDPYYQVESFDSPELLEAVIKEKASQSENKLSRIVASYDWPYSSKKRPDNNQQYWGVRIGNWFKPWNYETKPSMCGTNRLVCKKLAWAEQEHTIDEIGSTFTIQGFDLSYVGVILGPSVKYRNREIIYDPSMSCNNKAKQNRTLSDGSKKSFGELFIRNEIKVLMTRGAKGLFIYACDDELRQALKTIAKI